MNSVEALEKLIDDKHYYGEIGKQYLSNSDIGTLLNNPKDYGKDRPDNLNFLKGRYFHQAILEPQKMRSWEFVEASSRNTNIYKSAVVERAQEFLLLQKEKEELDMLVSSMKSNLYFYENIYMDGNGYEIPMVGEIKGKMWKGKADISCGDCLIDIKTTASIKDFKYSAKKYNYDSQCYIYQTLWGKPLVFYVIEKGTAELGVFRPSEDFIKGGENKVERAIEVYDRFFGENPIEDVSSYFLEDTL